ncbi:hypothetical protein [Peredibacter starrii]|uniref:Uncharacterized protein n=1 Tax=Peredibacter starrii TaxID=28202 RepID=A0AAX4HIW3_9BACT|nr:hypothetical protein [Peredibacter starrii]WPU63183.1 hypothetical protein SOO65_10850 [Peredibacter starrii]
MKNYIIFLATLTLIVGCDAPQRTRLTNAYSSDYNSGNPNNTSGSLPSGSTTGSTTGGTTGSSTGSTGFENCDLSSKGFTAEMGHIGICQSTLDETVVKFKSSLTSTSYRTCLIPSYKDGSGSSTYIGQPQCTYTEADKVMQGKLYKNRTGFEGYSLNNIIVMKEPLLTEYFGCMQGYTNWPANVCSGVSSTYCAYWVPRCPYGSKSTVACDAEARAYMTNLCTNFKNKYSSAYLDIKIK